MLETAVIFLLILLNGLFALAETAIVSSRRFRLQQLAEAGDGRATVALELYDRPTRFLSAVQIGITLIAIVAGAVGGRALAEPLAQLFDQVAWLKPYSQPLSLALVVALITYLTLIIGELVPKRIALSNPETTALSVASFMKLLARLAAPLVAFLSASTNGVLRLLPLADSGRPPVSEAEITGLLKQGAAAGVFEEAEHDIIENVFWFGERRIQTLMTPRHNIAWLDLNDDLATMQGRLSQHAHSFFVVSRQDIDQVEGIVSARDLLLMCLKGETLEIAALVQQPLFLPESMSALRALEQFKQSGAHLGLVVDEYGGIEGVLTLRDLLEGLVGNIPTPEELEQPKAVQREEGSWLIDGLLSIDDFRELFGISPSADDALEPHATVGGFVVARLGHLPSPTEQFEWSGLRFEVVDMDRGKVDKVLVSVLAGNDKQNS